MTTKTPAQRHRAWRERQDKLGLKRVFGFIIGSLAVAIYVAAAILFISLIGVAFNG